MKKNKNQILKENILKYIKINKKKAYQQIIIMNLKMKKKKKQKKKKIQN